MANRMVKRYLGFVSTAAFLLTGFGFCASAQTRVPESSQAIASKLNIVVIEGEGAINNIKARTAREVIVRVEDENHRPVAGATVAFTLPRQGASGTFLHGGRTLTIFSDQGGRAATVAIKPNHALGVFKINVSASLHGQVATAAVTQTNAIAGAAGAAGAGAAGAGAGSAGAGGAGAAGAGAGGMSAATIGGIAAGTAAVGAVAAKVATSGGDEASTPPVPPPTATIGAPGTPVIGPASLVRAPFSVRPSRGVALQPAARMLQGLAARGKSSSFRRGAIPPERRRAQKRYNAFLRPG